MILLKTRSLLPLIISLLLYSTVHAADLNTYDGTPLPDFTLQDMSGAAHSLKDYRGKVVLVNFWATYCGPCIRELPSMIRLKEHLAEKPFEILAINMAEERVDIGRFMQRHKIETNFPILLDAEGTVTEEWKVRAVPTTFVLDRHGKIQYALAGTIEWDSTEVIRTINQLLLQ